MKNDSAKAYFNALKELSKQKNRAILLKWHVRKEGSIEILKAENDYLIIKHKDQTVSIPYENIQTPAILLKHNHEKTLDLIKDLDDGKTKTEKQYLKDIEDRAPKPLPLNNL